MSQIFARTGERNNWDSHALVRDCVQLGSGVPVAVDLAGVLTISTAPLLVRSNLSYGREAWVLICAPSARCRVNGTEVTVGVRALAHRDAIALGNGEVVFYSAEKLASVEPFPGKDERTSCIRCKLPIESGTPAVRCPAPGCGFWHHQVDESACWSYSSGCASCGHTTSFDAGYQWTPSDI